MTIGTTTVSAVIPAFNRSSTLRRALKSVYGQTRRPDEVIVVDDGSTDDTPERVQLDFPDARLVRQPNAGVAAARNRGVDATTSDWIAFLDSDDEWKPEKLQRQMIALRDSSDYHICHTNEVWMRNNRRVNEGKRHEKSGGWIFQRCLPLCVISPSSVVVRRSLLLELGGFDEAMPVCEDYDMWLRICARYPVLFLEEQLTVKYGGHDDQLSQKYWGMDRFRIRALKKILAEDVLSEKDRAAAVTALLEKTAIYIDGARKRGRLNDAERYEALRRQYENFV